MSETKSSKVQEELEQLRQKQLAKNRRDKLKDLCSPLTTPEEAHAFLASMRDKSHQRDVTHQPPSNLSADGMASWHLQQRQREQELRRRRKEAEQILRGYRGGGGRLSLGTPTSIHSENMFQSPDPVANLDQHLEKEMTQTDTLVTLAATESSETNAEEKKEDDSVLKVESNDSSKGYTADYVEPETVWRDFISSEPGAMFPPEADRYHLYCSYACPGSHRALIVRSLKGLEDTVSVTYVHPTWKLTNPSDPEDKHRGWVFGEPNGKPFTNTINRGGPFPPAYSGNEPDPIFNATSIREIYEESMDNSGKYTIPVLFDKKNKTIVNNEASDIAYMLNSCFNEFAKNPNLDLFTEEDEDGMAKLNEVTQWLSPLFISGVYRCGFAKTQRAYNKAINELCIAFDHADDILQRQRFLTGDTLTDADIRLFVTLIRFDEVYAFYFKANARMVMLTPALLDFCREIYQMPGMAETCKMEQIKAHFFGSHPEWNKYSVIPRGLGFMELLDMPHNREDVSKGLCPY